MTLLVAILVGCVMAAIGTPYRTYETWWSWNRIAAGLGLFFYFLVGGGGAGVVGWLAGTLTGAVETHSWWIRGLTFGFAGAALVRAAVPVGQNDAKKRSDAKQTVAVQQTVSALGLCLSYVVDTLDYLTRRTSQNWFIRLTNHDLMFQSLQIQADILRQEISDAAKLKIGKKFVEAAGKLRTEADQDEGRAQLASFCAAYVAKEYMSKGVFVAAGRTARIASR